MKEWYTFLIHFITSIILVFQETVKVLPLSFIDPPVELIVGSATITPFPDYDINTECDSRNNFQFFSVH